MSLSRTTRLLYVIAAFFSTALMGGAVYGWPSMRQILRRDGTLRASACDTAPADRTCNEQEMSFGLIFTIGSWSNQGGRLLVGIVLDRAGTRCTAAACALACSLGALVFALTDSVHGLAIGLFWIGVGGAGMQLSLQSVSSLFPQNKGLVMAMLSGAFQGASGVFLLFETMHRLADVSLRALMLGYATALLVVAIISLILWPAQPFGVSKPAGGNDANAQRSNGSPVSAAADSQSKVATPAAELPLNKRSFKEQALSPEYLLMTTFFTVTVLQCQFTIGTIGTQLELKGDSGDMTRVFNLVFSLSWMLTPFVGHAIDRLGFTRMLLIMNTVLLFCWMCLLAPWLELQFATAFLYMVGRVSIWATFFSFNGFVFGFKNYGKLAGGGLFIGSCFSLLQYALLELTLDVFKGDFAFVNGFFVFLALAMYPVIARLAWQLRRSQSLSSADPQPISLVSDTKSQATSDVLDGDTAADDLEKSAALQVSIEVPEVTASDDAQEARNNAHETSASV